MQEEISAENERLRKHILALLDEHVELRKELSQLRNGERPVSPGNGVSNETQRADIGQINGEQEQFQESYLKEIEKSRLLMSRYSKELNEEERLVRALSSLQNNYDKLAFKYECLANSPLGKTMTQIWEVYNKIKNNPSARMR